MDVIVEFEKIVAKYIGSSDALMHYLTTYNFVPPWVLSIYMTFGDISRFYSVMKINDRQVVSKKYNLVEDELRTILRVLTLIRNSCAHRNRLYCFKHTFSLPTFDPLKHPNEYYFTTKGCENKNLFLIIICVSLLLPTKQMHSLVNGIKNELAILSKKLNVINIAVILKYLGFPTDWKKIIQ